MLGIMSEVNVEEAIKKYPGLERYKNNPRIIEILLSQLEGANKPLKDVKSGDTLIDREMLVIKLLNVNEYVGCPNCNTKFDGEVNTTFVCPKCGTSQVSTVRKFRHYLVGDETAIGSVQFAPKFDFTLSDNELVGKIIKISGVVRELKDIKGYSIIPIINVRKMEILGDVTTLESPMLEGFNAPDIEEDEPKLSDSDLTSIRTYFKVYNNHLTKDKFEKLLQNKHIDRKLVEPLIIDNGDFISLKEYKPG